MRRLMEELMTRKMWEKKPRMMLHTGKPPSSVSWQVLIDSSTGGRRKRSTQDNIILTLEGFARGCSTNTVVIH